MSTITTNYAGMIPTMREAVNDKGRKMLKASDFFDRDDFSAYKFSIRIMQKELSALECAASVNDKEEKEKHLAAFYEQYKKILKDYFSGDGVNYVASPDDHVVLASNKWGFARDTGDLSFDSMTEQAFRQLFERFVIHRIDHGKMRTAAEMIAAREAKQAAKKAAKKAAKQAAKEAAKQEKPDGRPEEIDVHKDKKEQQAKKEGAAA